MRVCLYSYRVKIILLNYNHTCKLINFTYNQFSSVHQSEDSLHKSNVGIDSALIFEKSFTSKRSPNNLF